MALTKEQKRVYDWLKNTLELPVFADVYEGAVFLLDQKPNGYISFVAHAGRDLMNGLAPTFKGVKRTQVQYSQLVGDIVDLWESKWGLTDALIEKKGVEGNFIPITVCQKIKKLIEEHKSGRIRSSESDGLFFSTFLDYTRKDKIPPNFLSEWKAAKDWFMGHTHLRKNSFSSGAASDLEKHFCCLDGYLYIAASSQYERLKALNEILDETNQ